MVRAQSKSHQLVKKMALRPSGGQGIRTLNPLRGTCTPNRPLAIRIPSELSSILAACRSRGKAKRMPSSITRSAKTVGISLLSDQEQNARMPIHDSYTLHQLSVARTRNVSRSCVS